MQISVDRLPIVAVCSLILALAACGSKETAEKAGDNDPALTGALGDQIMVDPEMTDDRGAAVSVRSGQINLPPEQRSAEAISAAVKEASKVAGGSLLSAPQPRAGGVGALAQGAATAAQVAENAKTGRADCAAKVSYSNTWAARLPAEIPVYPRGSVQEAAGTDADGCSMRVVNFQTPVSTDQVINFYYTMANKAGYGAEHRSEGGDSVLGGQKGGKAYVIYARKLDSGMTEVDLVTSGS